MKQYSSLASALMYPNYLVPLKTLLRLYDTNTEQTGGDQVVLHPHQVLLKRGLLVDAQKLPKGAIVIFVSHEWLSYGHPDPEAVQLKVLCKVLRRLQSGDIASVEMHSLHKSLYKENLVTVAEEWVKMFADDRVYLWIDYLSMPQPSAKDPDRTPAEQVRLDNGGLAAIHSIPAYVEMSSFVMVIAPGSHHADRKVATGYVSYRRRLWCDVELKSGLFSKKKSHPNLVVRSADGTPYWASPLDALLARTGQCESSCCQRNHAYTDAKGRGKWMDCDKPTAGRILKRLIDAKIESLFVDDKVIEARYYLCLEHWFFTGLEEPKEKDGSDDLGLDDAKVISEEDPIAALKTLLRWADGNDGVASKSNGWTLLQYAAFKDDASAVAELVRIPDAAWMINMRSQNEGYSNLGLYGGLTPLHAAMSYAGPDVVCSLLEAGAVPTARCSTGHDPFMAACQFGRSDLVDVWLQHNKGWNLERVDKYDSTVLNTAVYFGGNKTTIVRKLLDAGADVHLIDSNGVTLLMTAMANEDADMEMVQLIVDALRDTPPPQGRIAVGINTRTLPRTRKKRWLGYKYRLQRWMAHHPLLEWMGSCRAGVEVKAHMQGRTALHYAAKRGDAAAVRVLLDAGADPLLETATGFNALAYSRLFGPFPRVEKLLGELSWNEATKTRARKTRSWSLHAAL